MGTAQFFCFRVPVCLFRVGPCAQAEVMRRIKRRKTGAAGTSSVRRTCAGTPRGVMGKASRLKYEIKSVFRIRYCLLVRLGMDIVFRSDLGWILSFGQTWDGYCLLVSSDQARIGLGSQLSQNRCRNIFCPELWQGKCPAPLLLFRRTPPRAPLLQRLFSLCA